jgi:short-subunit dehydrogenase
MAQQASGGVLVNVASSAALQPLPGMAAYAASKAFVLSYSEALAEELAATAVRVITVCPGGTDTGFQAASGVRRVEGEKLMPAPVAAACIFRAIQRRQSGTVLIGGRTKAMALLARLLPRRTLVRLWGRLMNEMR